MGQATVDLPDPLQAPPSGKAAGADDLLAQMAGEEIDRLLAEAEADSVPVENPQNADAAAIALAFSTAPPPCPPDAAAPTSTDDALAGELDTLLNTLTTAREPAPDVNPSTIAPSPTDPVQTAEPHLSDSEFGISSTESAALRAGDDAGAVEPTVLASAAPSTVAPPAVMEETSAAERLALNAVPGPEPVEAAAMDSVLAAVADAATDEPEAQPQEEDASLPLLLRPLEWLNAPFAACPDLFRQFIGKAAILTVVNALALMAYVHFIRRH